MANFLDYSQYYDLLYQDKDYNAEAEYIFKLIKTFSPSAKNIIELGCGTGKHAKILSEKGLKIHGIDLSKTMLEQAEKLKNDNLHFAFGDVRNYRANQIFDTVISLFHVASYQNSNSDLCQYFETANAHLKSGGIFIFDFWYGPAVFEQKPEIRKKVFENNLIRIERDATPEQLYNENIVNVTYDISILDKKNNSTQKLHELHKMRYFFKPELELMLDICGFKTLHLEEFLSGNNISNQTWGICIIGEKK